MEFFQGAVGTRPAARVRPQRHAMKAIACAATLGAAFQAAGAPGAAACAAMPGLKIANTTVTGAVYMTSASGNYCQVNATVAPEHDVQVNLPDNWKGRYLQTGGGGFDGMVPHAGSSFGAAGNDLVANGYVVTADNGGHRGAEFPGVSFATDRGMSLSYATAKIYDTHLVAAALMQSYYGQQARYSYFTGCSNGGKNASVAAANFADYFDGIVGGDGVWGHARDHVGGSDMPGLTAKWAQTVQLGAITPAQGAALHAAVVQACDGLDGVRDGIVSNVQACNIPQVVHSMRCAGAPNGSCLSDADVDKVMGYITPLMQDHRVIGAPWAGTTNLATVGASSNGLGGGFLALALRTPVPVNPLTFDIPSQFADAAAVLDGVYSMTGDLDGVVRFLRSGKKLILFHGWEDPVVPSYVSVNFYKALNRADDDAARNSRLYMDPAVQHCGGGNGADSVDLLTTLTRWVEQNDAPGTPSNPTLAWKQGSATGPAGISGASFSRPLCAYPAYPQYIGRGDVNSASNYVCRPGTWDRSDER
jgi:feruloyl esterase